MDENFKKELSKFFLIFGAENSLHEADIEKLERVLHELQPNNMEMVEKMSAFIVKKKLLEKPEDEIVDRLHREFKK